MKKIAILGFGIVGGGIPQILEENAPFVRRAVRDEVEVALILDLRDFPDSPYADRIVKELDPILADPSIEVVCEAMGGSHPAFEFSEACLRAGKSVVTSNKEVVARFGDILLEEAKKNGVSYLFEASVGGGIPLIRPFSTSLAGDGIVSVSGIVNGTTNYILTRMEEEGMTFDAALAEAQALGYAERDPAADVDGIDARRKITILSGLAFGILPEEERVGTVSLRDLTPRDVEAARRLGCHLRLISRAERIGGKIAAYVCPMMVPECHILSAVTGVYNAVSVTSAVTGDILYYGRGAGRLPTAGAMVADVCAILSGAARAECAPQFTREPSVLVPFEKIPFHFYLRVPGSGSEAQEKLSAVCDEVKLLGEGAGGAELTAGPVDSETLTRLLPEGVKIRLFRG